MAVHESTFCTGPVGRRNILRAGVLGMSGLGLNLWGRYRFWPMANRFANWSDEPDRPPVLATAPSGPPSIVRPLCR